MTNTEFEFAVVEIMGHRRHAGRCREVQRFGTPMLQIDIPKVEIDEADQPEITGWSSHFYGGASIFSYTAPYEDTITRMNMS